MTAIHLKAAIQVLRYRRAATDPERSLATYHPFSDVIVYFGTLSSS